jgi:hypothetical protein
LSFIRYFSLPLALASKLRREVLSQRAPGESAALAAAAAADKGVRLSAETLRSYAAAIDPAFEDPPGIDGGEREAGRGSEEKHRREPEAPFFSKKPEKNPSDRIKSGDLQKKIEKIEANAPFLRLLNKIPGKNGRRWIIIPFTFSSKGVVFKVSVRILLNKNGSSGYDAERLGVDIAAGDAAGTAADRRRWLFVLDKPGKAGARAEVTFDPPLRASPEREVRKLLAPFAGEITVKEGRPSPCGDCRNDDLPSVNEEV